MIVFALQAFLLSAVKDFRRPGVTSFLQMLQWPLLPRRRYARFCLSAVASNIILRRRADAAAFFRAQSASSFLHDCHCSVSHSSIAVSCSFLSRTLTTPAASLSQQCWCWCCLELVCARFLVCCRRNLQRPLQCRYSYGSPAAAARIPSTSRRDSQGKAVLSSTCGTERCQDLLK